MGLIPLKPQSNNPPKLALDKISSVNFCKLTQITKKKNFGQVVLLFDINPI